jgi:hypothetical protein
MISSAPCTHSETSQKARIFIDASAKTSNLTVRGEVTESLLATQIKTAAQFNSIRVTYKERLSFAQVVSRCFSPRRPGQFLWTQWHWDKYPSKHFGISLVSIQPQVLHIHSFIYCRGYRKPTVDNVVKKHNKWKPTWKLKCQYDLKFTLSPLALRSV